MCAGAEAHLELARTLGPPARWIVLGLGLYVFVVLVPAVFGSFTLGRIVIGVCVSS